MKKILLHGGGFLGAIFTIGVVMLMMFPSIIFIELHASSHEPPAPVPASVTDDEYWTVKEIAPNLYAIGELSWYQKNWHYLVVGTNRAVLFDTGTGRKSIKPIIDRLTDLPVTAMVSHLHYDHTGNLHEFSDVLMLDVPAVRKLIDRDVLNITRYRHLGFIDDLESRPVRITQWIDDGAAIDVGDRELVVKSIPGHTKDSLVLFDPASKMMFMGDTLHRGTVVALVPGSSRSDYIDSLTRLIEEHDSSTVLLGGHAARDDGTRVPEMEWSVLVSLRDKLVQVATGELEYEEGFPRSLPVADGVVFLSGPSWANR